MLADEQTEQVRTGILYSPTGGCAPFGHATQFARLFEFECRRRTNGTARIDSRAGVRIVVAVVTKQSVHRCRADVFTIKRREEGSSDLLAVPQFEALISAIRAGIDARLARVDALLELGENPISIAQRRCRNRRQFSQMNLLRVDEERGTWRLLPARSCRDAQRTLPQGAAQVA